MAFEEGTDRLVCPACGAAHVAKWSRIPVREWQTIRCESCQGILFYGRAVRDYFEVYLEQPRQT
jgi:hypothetical protein